MVEAWLEYAGHEGRVVGLRAPASAPYTYPSMAHAGFESLHLLLYPWIQACLHPAHPTPGMFFVPSPLYATLASLSLSGLLSLVHTLLLPQCTRLLEGES